MRRNKRSRVSAALRRFVGDECGFFRLLLDPQGGETGGYGGGTSTGTDAGSGGGDAWAGAGSGLTGSLDFNPRDGGDAGAGAGGTQGQGGDPNYDTNGILMLLLALADNLRESPQALADLPELAETIEPEQAAFLGQLSRWVTADRTA